MLVITKCKYKSHSLSITWANDDPSQWLIWTIGLLWEANIRGPLNYYGLTLIPVWIYNYLHYKVWDELLTHSQTSKVAQLKLGMDKKFHPTHLEVCDYLSMLRFKLNHVSERGPWGSFQYHIKCFILDPVTYRNHKFLESKIISLRNVAGGSSATLPRLP